MTAQRFIRPTSLSQALKLCAIRHYVMGEYERITFVMRCWGAGVRPVLEPEVEYYAPRAGIG